MFSKYDQHAIKSEGSNASPKEIDLNKEKHTLAYIVLHSIPKIEESCI